MKNLKICVYAICKNESKFIKRWLKSIKDADYICVLDTGSTDNSIELLKDANVILGEKTFEKFRFDEARNESLKLVPKDTDVYICLDIDEVMLPGWRKAIEKVWQDDTTRLRYIYNWSLDEYNNPKVSFYQDKIHGKDYIWVNPVHEILKYLVDNENYVQSDELIIDHYPDQTKSRSSYLPLLELAVSEDSENDRNMHYLGREYMYYGKWEESIATLKRHLNIKNATWNDERCASMRFIARDYKNLGDIISARVWLEAAIKEAPHLRDPLVELALLYYDQGDWQNVIRYCKAAQKIPINCKTYINEVFSFDETIDDILSLAYYNIGDIPKAIEHANNALAINPNNERIQNNLRIMQERSQ